MMKYRRSDSRLSIHTYLEAIRGVETQFALIRFALKKLSKEEIQAFYKAQLRNALSNIESVIQKSKEYSPDKAFQVFEAAGATLREHLRKEHRKENRKADTRFKVELSEDRLNQSELLLLVAYFESFMKEVHSTFLTAAPAKIFSKRDTKVMLRKVFDGEAADPFGKFLKELIIKEVKSLDARKIEERADYFLENYGISIGSEKKIDDLKEIMATRNKISHAIYASPPRSAEQVTDRGLVGDGMLKRARELFVEIPTRCLEAGAKMYPCNFR